MGLPIRVVPLCKIPNCTNGDATMINVPEPIATMWSKQHTEVTVRGAPRVSRFTESEVAEIESLFGQTLPEDYKQFVLTFGGVIFYDNTSDNVNSIPHNFIYTYSTDGFSQNFEGVIGSMSTAKGIMDAYKYMIDDADNETEESFFPPNMLPFAGDLEENYLLLELGTDNSRVWFWEDKPDAWGEAENTLVGFVANSFTDLLNSVLNP